MPIIKHRKIFIGISIALVVLSLLAVVIFPPRAGIDFKGGALTEVAYTARPDAAVITAALAKTSVPDAVIQTSGDNEFIVKTHELTEPQKAEILSALNTPDSGMEVKSYNSIGPSIGAELRNKSIIAGILVVLAIIIFIAFAFRRVSKPVSSWRYGLIAVVTLLHDITIPIGIFAILGHFFGVEVDTLFVVAVLTVLGLSVSDTIVVFDRIRENLKNHFSSDFSETVGKSLEQVYPRSINTSLTVILVLLSLVFFGPTSTKYLSLMLAAGMFFGTYSSIFLASPLLVVVEGWQKQKAISKRK